MDPAHFASALSTDADPEVAFARATKAVVAGLGGVRPDLLVAFVSHHHGDAIEQLGPRLAQATGARSVLGCTGESIVGADQEVERGPALALWAGVLPNTKLRPFAVEVVQQDDETLAFSRLPTVRDRGRASLLILADPFAFPMSEYLEVLNARLAGVPAVGGMASGGQGPGQNFLFTGDGLVTSGAVGVVIEGDVEVRSIVSQGCRPVGRPFVITGCKDNFVLKLGGKSAVQVLMETLHELPTADRALLQSRPFVGLAIDPTKSAFERGDFLVRMLIGIEPQQGALALNDGSIRTGMTVQFLVRDAESAGEDLTHLMRDSGVANDGGGTDPGSIGALVFSCNGRGTRMFATPNHDIGCVQAIFPTQVPAAGFFANGEIGPVGGRNFLHGFTASVAVFRPRANGGEHGHARDDGRGDEHDVGHDGAHDSGEEPAK